MELARSIIGEEPTMQSEIKTWRLLHRRRPISIGPNGFFSLFLATTLFVSLGLFSGQKWTGRLSLFRRIPGARWPHSPPGDVTAGQIICTAKMKQRKIPPIWHESSCRTDSNWILFCFATGFLNFKNKKREFRILLFRLTHFTITAPKGIGSSRDECGAAGSIMAPHQLPPNFFFSSVQTTPLAEEHTKLDVIVCGEERGNSRQKTSPFPIDTINWSEYSQR